MPNDVFVFKSIGEGESAERGLVCATPASADFEHKSIFSAVLPMHVAFATRAPTLLQMAESVEFTLVIGQQVASRAAKLTAEMKVMKTEFRS